LRLGALLESRRMSEAAVIVAEPIAHAVIP
jgi:hypothetical protein